MARGASMVNTLVFGGRAKLPSILIPVRLHARFKPLRYSNKRLHEALGWNQRYTLAQALDRSLGMTPAPLETPRAGAASARLVASETST